MMLWIRSYQYVSMNFNKFENIKMIFLDVTSEVILYTYIIWGQSCISKTVINNKE